MSRGCASVRECTPSGEYDRPVPVIEIPVSEISDWDTFHDVFAAALGFPDFYGRNMDAWIDCLTYADEDDGMRSVVVPPGDVLTLQFAGGYRLRRALSRTVRGDR